MFYYCYLYNKYCFCENITIKLKCCYEIVTGKLKRRIHILSESTLKQCFRVLIVSLFMVIFSTSVFADLGDTLLKKDMDHSDVKVLKEKLAKLGYLEGSDFDSVFDEATDKALKNFQKEYNLKQDGIVGKDTADYIEKLEIQYENILKNHVELKRDDTGETVIEIQNMLKATGLLDATATGLYGEKTEQAVIDFQEKFGIAKTGIVDSMTYMKLKSVSDTGLSDRASQSRARTNSKLVDYAKKFQGVRYSWGSSSPKGFDCSGFTSYVLKNFGVNLEHQASRQFNKGTKVERNKLWPGDLVFFKTGRAAVGHVGIYIGNDNFIHASTSKKKVVIDSLSQYSKYSTYIGARRYDLD